MSNLKFTFNLDELNLILAGLGELKARSSLDIITKIQDEAKAQIKPIDGGDKIDPKQELKLEFSIDQVNLLLEGLRELPAKMSMEMIKKFVAEAESQIKAQEEKEEKVVSSKSEEVAPQNSHHTNIPVSSHSEAREVEVKNHDFE